MLRTSVYQVIVRNVQKFCVTYFRMRIKKDSTKDFSIRIPWNIWNIVLQKHVHMLWQNITVEVESLHKKWSFPLRISSVNVTKSAVSCASFFMRWILKWSLTLLDNIWVTKCKHLSALLICLLHHLKLQKQPSEVFYKKGVLKNFAKFTRKFLKF